MRCAGDANAPAASGTPPLLERVQALVAAGRWTPSEHGRHRMDSRAIPDADLRHSLPHAQVVETYPNDPRGPSMLLLQHDRGGNPFHAVWGLKSDTGEALAITAYYPDPARWETDFLRRRQR